MYDTPVKKTKTVTITKVISPATTKNVDTGNKQVITVIDETGTANQEERPIYQKVQVDAVTTTVEKEETYYSVATPSGEEHEFKTLKEANDFIKVSS